MIVAGPALALMVAIAQTTAPPEAQPTEAQPTNIVQATAEPDDRMTVPITIGAVGPFRFLVDTGAQNSVISHQTAAALGLVSTATRRVMSVAGAREVGVVNVAGLRMGGRKWHGHDVPVLARDDLGADGIVGLDGLQGQRVMIDFRQNQITLSDSSRQRNTDRDFDIVVTARRQRGELILTNAIADGVKVDVVIDTGSDITVGNRALQQALAQTSPSLATTLRSVTGQEIPADLGLLKSFGVDRIRIANVQVAYTDSPTFRLLKLHRRPAVLLGIHALRLFERVAIDFATKQVLFDVPPGF